MPDKPEKNINDLLNEYARARKESAAERISLSPLARRQLVNEALKVYGKERKFRQFILLFQRPFLLKAGFALGVLLIGAIIIRFIFVQPREMSLAYKPAEKELPASAAKSYLADKTKEKVLPEENVRSLKIAKARESEERVATSSALPMEKKPEVTMNKTAAVVPKSPALVFEKSEKSATTIAGHSQTGVKSDVDEKQQALAAATSDLKVKVEKPSPKIMAEKLTAESEPEYRKLLNRFRIIIDGAKIVLTDEDGSTYEGEIFKPVINGENLAKKDSGLSERIAETSGEKEQIETIIKSTTTNDIIFSVKGTNQNSGVAIAFYGKISGGIVSATGQQEFQTDSFSETRQRTAPSGMRATVVSPSATAGLAAPIRRAAPTITVKQETAGRLSEPTQQTNVLIEGLLFINGKTNLRLRAIQNQDGYYIKD
ncbi:MAG: hypothetical protein ACP5T0_13290 [Verrucomicrobiia bacterium]